MIAYRFRKSTFEKEKTFSLLPNGLSIQEEQLPEKVIAYSSIRSIRLCYMPDRMRTNNYQCHIETDKDKLQLMSWSYVSLANFKEDKENYRALVLELIARVHAANPRVLLLSGRPRGAYYGSIFFMAVAFIVLAILFSKLGASISGLSWLKLALLLLMIPLAISYIKKNKPGNFSAAAVPPSLLP